MTSLNLNGKLIVFASLLGVSLSARQVNAWEYIDANNQVLVSGNSCRAGTAANEYYLYHYPGFTTTGTWSSGPIRVYCPINRRNMHAYDKQMGGGGERIQTNGVWIKTSSSSGTLQCRMFFKDVYSTTVNYTPWQTAPTGYGQYIFMNNTTQWNSLNWGVLCDLPPGDSIMNIEIRPTNNNI